jgi:hypothetical protein
MGRVLILTWNIIKNYKKGKITLPTIPTTVGTPDLFNKKCNEWKLKSGLS